jgi:hypothetical protein
MMLSLQNGEQEELKVVSFVLQKQGETETKEVPFNQDDKGTIEIQTSFDEDGIYNLRAKIQTGNQTLHPTRQIVVGEVTEGKQEQKESDDGESSHH